MAWTMRFECTMPFQMSCRCTSSLLPSSHMRGGAPRSSGFPFGSAFAIMCKRSASSGVKRFGTMRKPSSRKRRTSPSDTDQCSGPRSTAADMACLARWQELPETCLRDALDKLGPARLDGKLSVARLSITSEAVHGTQCTTRVCVLGASRATEDELRRQRSRHTRQTSQTNASTAADAARTQTVQTRAGPPID